MQGNIKGKFKVITLCGSSKFKKEFIEVAEKLSLEGNIVISLGLFGHADNKFNTVITDDIKAMLDAAHKQKIEMSDAIYVINPGGYIGDSTRSEISYAINLGKEVHFLEPIKSIQKIGDIYKVITDNDYISTKNNISSVGEFKSFLPTTIQSKDYPYLDIPISFKEPLEFETFKDLCQYFEPPIFPNGRPDFGRIYKINKGGGEDYYGITIEDGDFVIYHDTKKGAYAWSKLHDKLLEVIPNE